jgi:hypothetical protein
MSDLCSAGSAGSTTDSRGLGFDTRSSVRAILGDEGCSPTGSPASPSTTTYETWVKAQKAHDPDDCERWEQTDLSPTLDAAGHAARTATLIFSAAASPVKTSQSPDNAKDSKPANAQASSSSSPDVQTSLFQPEGGSSLRTFPDYFPARTDEISPSYSRRWPSSGFTTSPGECWTADTSECPNDGAVSSSLADVLQDDVPSKYFLSPKAAAGILRRAEKRGRELPSHLLAALEQVARTTTTDKPAE